MSTSENGQPNESILETSATVSQCADSSDSHKITINRSNVWKFFKKVNAKEAKCLTCGKILRTKTSSTSSLIRHISLHPRSKASYLKAQQERASLRKSSPKRKKQASLTELYNLKKLSPTDRRAREITKAITLMIALDLQPYSIVDDAGFRNLIEVLEPKYEIPSRTTFSRSLIPELFEKEKANLKTELQCYLESENGQAKWKSVALTTDMWSSRAHDSYLSLTLHYINMDMELVNRILGNVYFPGEHTGTALFNKLTQLLNEWGLNSVQSKVYVVTDNARNFRSALNQSNWVGLSCFAHTLQLSIVDAKRDTTGIVPLCHKARAIVGHYRHSNQARGRLKQLQKQMGRPSHELIQDVDTRWNSELAMMERLLEQKEPLCAELASSDGPEMLTSGEWKLVEGMVEVLKPIEVATREVCVEDYPTLSMRIPLIYGIESALTNFISNSTHFHATLFAKNLLKALRSRFPMYRNVRHNKEACLAMVLDPRFRGILLSPTEKDAVSSEILQQLQANHSSEDDFADFQELEDFDVSHSEKTENTPSIWSTFEQLAKSANESQSLVSGPEEELQGYLPMAPIPRHKSPLKWWKEYKYKFPCLVQVARHYLAIPATQVASERLFSISGNIITARRENLLPEHAEQLLFLSKNIHGKLKEKK